MASKKVTPEEIYKLCNSEDYKDRFRGEYYQLKERTRKLKNMINTYNRGNLNFEPDCPMYLLHSQLEHMEAYLSILEFRSKIEGIKL